MQLQLKCSCGQCQEWAIIELQGSIELKDQNHLRDLDIGPLCRSSADKFFFTVGYHELEGRKVALKKPLLVIKKVKSLDSMDVDVASIQSNPNVQLEVVGVIRHKLLFKTRPKALISKPELKVKKPRTTSESIPV